MEADGQVRNHAVMPLAVAEVVARLMSASAVLPGSAEWP